MGFLNKARNFLTRKVFKVKNQEVTERKPRSGSVLNKQTKRSEWNTKGNRRMPEKLSTNNNTPVRNNTRKTYRHVQGFAQAEENRSATTPYTAKAAAQRREGAPYKSLKLVTTPKAKTMQNILRNLAPAPKTRSKALLRRLGKNNSAAAAAVAVQAAEAAEAASATAQQAAVVATQGAPVKGRNNNLASINFSAQEQPRPNIGKLFNEFEANNWVRQGRAANLGRNFNVFGYEPKRGLWNNRRKLIKNPFNNTAEELKAAPPIKADPLASLPSNWNMYTKESMNQRAANAAKELLMKKIRGPSTTRYHGMPNRLNRMREA